MNSNRAMAWGIGETFRAMLHSTHKLCNAIQQQQQQMNLNTHCIIVEAVHSKCLFIEP